MATLFRRILVPHDFSEPATRALEVAADLAAPRRGRLLVLHVIPPIHPPHGRAAWFPDAALVARERRRLEAMVERVAGGRRLHFECRVAIGGPLERILDAARGVDSIVMSTAGRTGIPRLLIGSVAERVVRHSPVPVLTVRSQARSVRRRPRAAARRPTRARAARRR
jgi:nucleotide-binding universal stress UspA family protein